MKLATYNKIIELMRDYNSRNCLKDIAKIYPEFSLKTLGSIYSQDYQRKMKRTHYKHYKTDRMETYYHRYCEASRRGGKQIILKMADEVDLSPALLARIILERYICHTQFSGDPVPKSLVTQMIKDTTLIPDPGLAHEVNMCQVSDDIYGSLVDVIKHSIGHEYEHLLKKKVEENDLAYLGEEQLRAKGYDKTPDIKLQVPIAVDGHTVNWIESKASFGDEDSHKGYLKEQFWSYWNRFGPGLVIYWFGFIEELDVNRDKGILLMDMFPEDITTMNPALLSSAPVH